MSNAEIVELWRAEKVNQDMLEYVSMFRPELEHKARVRKMLSRPRLRHWDKEWERMKKLNRAMAITVITG